jgi:hypothetical protein
MTGEFTVETNLHDQIVISCLLHARVISSQINITQTPQNWMIFCEIAVLMEISIPAKFYCFMAYFWQQTSEFVRNSIWAQVVSEKVA